MKKKTPRLIWLALASSLVGLWLVSCGGDTYIRTGGGEKGAPGTMIIERLEHGEDGLSVAEKISVDRVGQEFQVAGVEMHLLERWAAAETVRETSNDGDKESHAVELSWGGNADGDGKAPVWIYQTDEEGPAGRLPGTEVQVRVLPPGARPAGADQWATEPRDTVQFGRAGQFYPVSPVGGEVFPGWGVKGIRTFEHALVGESGQIEESPDGEFTNRCIEVTIAADDGTIERHVCFIDHPKLTKGIHPALLPVSRLAGSGASQSRLAARDPLELERTKIHRLLLSPHTDPITGSENGSGRITAYTWNHSDKSTALVEIDQLPADISVGGTDVRLLQHLDRAQSVVKWQKLSGEGSGQQEAGGAKELAEGEAPSDPLPALLLMWLEGHEHRRTVLPFDLPTPVKINGEFQVLRYRSAE